MRTRKQLLISSFLAWTLFIVSASSVMAQTGKVLGIHILHPYELEDAAKLIQPGEEAPEEWRYVTIPLSFDDTNKKEEWQQFFDRCRDAKIIPIVRMVTRFEDGSWAVPNRKEITNWIEFTASLRWPTDEKHIIILNEPNHANEFGGRLDPEGFAEVLDFTARWAKSEDKNYVILPGAMDLAATSGGNTLEAFAYLDRMLAHRPEVFSNISAWNSHSYANPGFSASPERTDKKSLRGFQHELAYLKEKTGQAELRVYITETGWLNTKVTNRWLPAYYEYAYQHVWSDPRVVAVTPFVLRGDPGPFSGFTFIDKNNKKTTHYQAYQSAVELDT